MKHAPCLLFLLLSYGFLSAQPRITREVYIKTYADIAVEEMRVTGIPASIKLAQALLESDNGNSTLARKANNHFGIKCHSDWKGGTFHKDDDKKDECFRRYRKVEESYHDHSLFLTQRERYRDLFKLNITDYKGWAQGLKKAGYATNPRYPQLLIKIIEDNRLYQYDQGVVAPQTSNDQKITPPNSKSDFPDVQLSGHQTPLVLNGVKYVTVQSGENLESIARQHHLNVWILRKFNEAEKHWEPTAGGRVFLQPKKRKADTETHIVQAGESLWDISMQYAVKLKRIEKLNGLERQDSLSAGQQIKLR